MRLRTACLLALVIVAAPAPGAEAKAKPRPDLALTTVQPPAASLLPGAWAQLSATVRNGGRAKAGKAVLRAYLARGTKRAKGDAALVGSLRVKALKPRKKAAVKGSLAIPATVNPGSYRLIACVTVKKDAKAANNCRAAALSVMIAAPGGAATPTPIPGVATPSPSPAASPTAGPSPTASPGPSATASPTATATESPTPSPSPSPSPTPSGLPGEDEPVPPPPDPPQAPPLPGDTPGTTADQVAFLYTGPDKIQTGVDADTIEPRRVGVLRGRVLDANGAALPSVTVTVLDHPELGQTITRADGRYDFAVNAGGGLTLTFERPTFLTAQRDVNPDLRDFEVVEDVVLRQFDGKVTEVDPGANAAQVATSSTTTDADGSRKANLIFLPDTHATMRFADDHTEPLHDLHVRATEYTVGDRGPDAMPGELPGSSGYTYAIDYSVDEAVEAGATGVEFDKPVVVYTDNFIEMPVGMTVPMGSYDATTSSWLPEPNGKVLKIVGVSDGKADVDLDGDGVADDPASLGITDAERTELATLYPVDAEVWRAKLSHFSPWDHNWPYGPPPDAKPPKKPKKPKKPKGKDFKDPKPPCKKESGSFIDCTSEALRESLAVAGTPFTLNYTSDRAGLRHTSETEIPLTEATIPASLARVELDVSVLGRKTHVEVPAAPNLTHTYTWDGKDAYGRVAHGTQQALATITYVYPAVYRTPEQNNEAFGRFGNALTAVPARQEIRISVDASFEVQGAPLAPPAALGGWTLSPNHALDTAGNVLQLGDGDSQPATVSSVSRVLSAQSDPAEVTYPDYRYIKGATWQPDGSVWYTDWIHHLSAGTDDSRVMRIAPNGTQTKVADLPGDAYNGMQITAAPDGGAWVLLRNGNGTKMLGIKHVAPDGTVTNTTAGGYDDPPTPNGGDGMLAKDVVLDKPATIDTGPGGQLYIDTDNASGPGRVQRIGADGVLETVYTRPDDYWFYRAFAVGPDGSLYLEHGIYGGEVIDRVLPSGDVVRVVGGGFWPDYCCFNGQIATDAYLYGGAETLEVDDDGRLIFATGGGLWELTPNGTLRRTAGGWTGSDPDSSSGGPAEGGDFQQGGDVSMDTSRDGTVVYPTRYGLRTVEPGIGGYATHGFVVPSQDGRSAYRFDTRGRHTGTVDAITGDPRLSFDYDGEGRLASITDADDNVTTIERDGDGDPTAIVAPGGERTALSLNADGNLATVTRPGGLQTKLTTDTDGLLTTEVDAAGGTHTFTYDGGGFIETDTDPDGVTTTLDSVADGDDRVKTLTSESGKTLTVREGGDEVTGYKRTVTDSNGASVTDITDAAGGRTTTLDDGRTAKLVPGLDPRFGALLPFAGRTETTLPGGSVLKTTQKRETSLTDPKDPFSVDVFKDTYFLSDSSSGFTRTYKAGTRTLTQRFGGDDRVATAVFDAHGHQTSVRRDTEEDAETSTYDDAGRLERTEQGNSHTDYTYDARGRLATRTDALDHTYTYDYDGAGRTVSTTTPGNHEYAFAHDGLDRMTKLTSPLGAITSIGWTPGGRLDTYKPPGSGPGYDYDYDQDGLAKSTKQPSGAAVTLGRNAGGRVTSITAPGATVAVDYVAKDNRPASITRTPGGGTAQGLAFTYDGDLTKSVTWSGSADGRYDFGYDAEQSLAQAKLTVGATTVTTDITRDSAGQIYTQGPFTVGHAGPRGAISSMSGAGVSIEQTWDARARLATRTSKANGTTVHKIDLERDAAGALTEDVVTVGADAPFTLTYSRDADGRLTDVRRNGTVVEHYAYDVDGNRTVREAAGSAATATYDANGLITGLGAVDYDVGTDGFVTKRGADTFTWSARGELLSATVGGVTQGYAYDGLRRLVARTASGSTWRYLYGNPDQQLQATAAIEPDGTLWTLDYSEAGVLVSAKRGSTRYTVGTDAVGSPRVVADASTGTIARTTDFTAFGEIRGETGSLALPIGFAGGIADPVAKVVHLGMRPYDPASGRFMARDPLAVGGGTANLYAYADNDPVGRWDPLGLASLGTNLCAEGFCVGTKLAITDEGLSVCTEAGVGVGNDVEFNPLGGLDDDKAYAKVSGSASLGPIVGAEVTYEHADKGDCTDDNISGKVCAVGVCVDSGEGIKGDPNKMKDLFHEPAKFGLEGKALLGVCQKILF